MISRVSFRVAAANFFERPAAQAEIFGRHGVAPHGAIAQFGNVRFAGNRNFVEAVGAVKNERAPARRVHRARAPPIP